MDALLENFAKVDWLVGATIGVLFVCGLLGGLVLLNQWRRFYVSYAFHLERVEAERRRADKAEADAASDADALRAELARRMADFRADFADRMRQVSRDHGRALETLTKILDSKDRDIESWRTAWNLSDQANQEEDDARWNEIRAAVQALLRVVTEPHRHHPAESHDDGGRTADVR